MTGPGETLRARSVTLETRDLAVSFPVARNVRDRLARRPASAVHAVDGVDLSLTRGQALGLVGESGCGKSTLAFCLAGLIAPTRGEILLDGTRVESRRSVTEQRRIQIVFQDPYSSLDPYQSVGSAIKETLSVNGFDRSRIADRIKELFGLVGLPETYIGRLPATLSGGERQRVAIARALAVEPRLIVCDEPVSALDVSVQAQVLNLFCELKDRLGLSYLFITHDLAVVRQVVDRVYVCYRGHIVEQGPVAEVLESPKDPYTIRLISSIPRSTKPDEPRNKVPVPLSPSTS